MIFVLFIANCVFGLAVSALAKDRIRGDGLWAAPPFALILGFSGIVMLPATLYLAWAHRDWTFGYIWEGMPDPAAAGIGALVCCTLPGFYVLGGSWLRRRRVLWLQGAAAILSFVGAGLVVALLPRLSAYGDYNAFHAGRGQGVWEVKLGYVLVVIALGLTVVAVAVVVAIARDRRRVRRR